MIVLGCDLEIAGVGRVVAGLDDYKALIARRQGFEGPERTGQEEIVPPLRAALSIKRACRFCRCRTIGRRC
jgi:hypothetical protein